jgi:uncharacterized protein (UPF0212 family)
MIHDHYTYVSLTVKVSLRIRVISIVLGLMDCGHCGERINIQLESSEETIQCHACGNDIVVFAFQSRAWRDAEPIYLEMQQVFRQQDPEFIRVLNKIRIGEVSPEIINMLHSCRRPLPMKEGDILVSDLVNK